jgi:hypothetical protein
MPFLLFCKAVEFLRAQNTLLAEVVGLRSKEDEEKPSWRD